MEVNVVMSQLLILHSLCGKILQNFITCCFIYICVWTWVQWKGVGGIYTESDPWKSSFALSVTIGCSLQLDAGNC